MYVFYSLSLRWYVGVVVSYIEYVNWPFFLVMTFFSCYAFFDCFVFLFVLDRSIARYRLSPPEFLPTNQIGP